MNGLGYIDWETIQSSDNRAELEQLVEMVDANRQAHSDLTRAQSARASFMDSVRSACRPLLEHLSEAEVPVAERIGAIIGADASQRDLIQELYSNVVE